MELVEAIKARKSIRGFKPVPVPRETVTRVLDLARHAPSVVNNQPWEFIVLGGEALSKVKSINETQLRAEVPPAPELSICSFSGLQRDRQVTLGRELYRLMGIGREDRLKRLEWAAKGNRFYDAPAAIIVCVEDISYRQPMCLVDVGTVIYAITLAAVEAGLGTCVQQQVVFYPDAVRKALDIPDSKRIIVGIAIGYPDEDFPANSIRTERETLDKLITWRGL
ncbi:MAG: nitroreductase [Chloroflexi bacterium]|nr:nitroreductase [Chloroflexota bacterium]